jgi:hypothetical protein
MATVGAAVAERGVGGVECDSLWNRICGNPDQSCCSLYRNTIRCVRTATIYATTPVFYTSKQYRIPMNVHPTRWHTGSDFTVATVETYVCHYYILYGRTAVLGTKNRASYPRY